MEGEQLGARTFYQGRPRNNNYVGTPSASGAALKPIIGKNATDTEMKKVFAGNADYLREIGNKAASIKDTTLYACLNVAGAKAKSELLDVNSKKKVGITNFDGPMLGTDRHATIRSIRTKFTNDGGVTATVEEADWDNLDVMPAALANAELQIKQADVLVFSCPISDLQNFKLADFREVFNRPVLLHNKPISIDVVYPIGLAVPATNVKGEPLGAYFKVELRVAETTSKN